MRNFAITKHPNYHNTEEMSQRISYIDSAKALCILFVVAMHTSVPALIPGSYDYLVAVFFFLSGFFFSAKQDFKDFMTKKWRTLIIPFLFFYICSYILFYIGRTIYPDITKLTPAKGIMDCFFQKDYFNGPLWFLPCLLWIQIIAYCIKRFINNSVITVLIVSLIGSIGYYLGKYNIFLPLSIDTALTSIPFFFAGIATKNTDIFNKVSSRWGNLLLGMTLYIPIILIPTGMWLAGNKCYANIVQVYSINIIAALSIVFILKSIEGWDKWINYIGRNTLLILCIHHIIYRPLKMIVPRLVSDSLAPYIVFALTLIISLILIPFFDKYLPWSVGKKKKA